MFYDILKFTINSWDEWVGMDRLLKFTDENIKRQQALAKKQGADKHPKTGRSSQMKPKSSTGEVYSLMLLKINNQIAHVKTCPQKMFK